ncbi:MAG: methyltransferase domain-containing protein [Candidatus Thiodiazotropha sp.]
MKENTRLKLGPCQQNQLCDWFGSHLGDSLAAQEAACFQRLVAAIFGYYVVQVGHLRASEDLLLASPARNQVILGIGPNQESADLYADPSHLPFAEDSLDGILLPHTLDFSIDPHQLLREVERVLIPEGKVLLSGFNPWSLWGLWRLPHLRSTSIPWCGHFFSSRRVIDWLSLLGFDLKEVHYLNFKPPLQRPGIMQRLQFMEGIGSKVYPRFGGVYIILAVKREVTVTPIRPKWSVKKRVIPAATEPTIRNGIGPRFRS